MTADINTFGEILSLLNQMKPPTALVCAPADAAKVRTAVGMLGYDMFVRVVEEPAVAPGRAFVVRPPAPDSLEAP